VERRGIKSEDLKLLEERESEKAGRNLPTNAYFPERSKKRRSEGRVESAGKGPKQRLGRGVGRGVIEEGGGKGGNYQKKVSPDYEGEKA